MCRNGELMAVLTTEHRRTLIDLLTPLNITVGERRALIYASLGTFDIELEGSPLEFTIRLIERTLDHGQIEPGKHALWAVLDSIRPYVGVEKQPVIDALYGPIHAAPIPKPDKPATPITKKRRLRSDELTDDGKSRQILLSKVQEFWVEGVFRPALKNDIWLELPVSERPQAVEPTPDRTLRYADYEPINLTRRGEMGDLFRGTGRALLILGAPGAGKTMTLLELANTLIQQAQKDPKLPTPIVLNLSSWAENRPEKLEEWIAERLDREYGVSKQAAARWIANGDLTYLLDGLDEVPTEHREACVTAINAFWQGRDWVDNGIVVCSRVAEYEELTERLQMRNAILLEALPLQTALDYLGQLGPEWGVLRAAVTGSAVLQDMATSPLLLNIMVVAYRGAVRGEIPASNDEGEQRRVLFDRYVARCLREGQSPKQYPHEKTRHYLAWLARGMNGQTVFHIEDLSGNWVGKPPGRVRRFLARYKPADRLVYSWMYLGKGLVIWLLFGVVGGLVGLIGENLGNLFDLPITGMYLSVIGFLFGLAIGSPIGLGIGLGQGLSLKPVEQRMYPNQQISRSIRVGQFGVLVFGLISGMYGGLFSLLIISASNLLLEGICGTLFVWLVGGLFGGIGLKLSYKLASEISYLPILALFGALVGGLDYGLGFALHHYLIRRILYRSGDIPRNYAEFLIYAADRHLLRRVGGGFVFRHRLLLEHFAESGW